MKKILLLITSVILLSACSSKEASSNSAAQTVKQVYEAALNQDSMTFRKIMSQHQAIDGNYSEAISELADIVHSLGGTEKLSFKELKNEDIQKEVLNHLDNKYENGWKMVLVSPQKGEEGETFAWILNKVDGDYYVLEGEETAQKEILKIVNGKNIEEERAEEERQKAEDEQRKAKEEEQKKNEAKEQYITVVSQLVGQTWEGSHRLGQLELSFTDVVQEDIYMDEFPSYISVPIKATAKLTDVRVEGHSERLTVEMAMEGSLSTGWDDDPKEAFKDSSIILDFKELITTPSIDIPTDDFGFIVPELNLNSESKYAYGKLITAPGEKMNFTLDR
ncbi:hypothetical protein QT711_18080 [Sporosarcina saromensis]|uniref:DUF5105 domain-containing protein n=1 Tax=Sporosarcina saromensis TaxID=359365 RepID=A0ABU4GFK3_9BACL|nr:hypothetical protein [Sporosarcina saromensis]MDW0115073.1 hypothetical protein [Sporosarcina saromensis]